MSIGWFVDLSDAEDYFDNERLETECWDDLLESGTFHQETKAILTAYNRIYYDPRWALPTYAEATAAELVILRIANAEEAYYLACHLSDEDRRKGIQAQGVIEAGIVKEKYSEGMLMALPVPAEVIALLTPWLVEGPYIGVANLAREEEESTRTKVHAF
jgi:hypothetical protein